MNVFQCALDEKAELFCLEIAEHMREFFQISQREAIGRIEEHWKDIKIGGPGEIAYHQDAEKWAKDIYYTSDSFYWVAE